MAECLLKRLCYSTKNNFSLICTMNKSYWISPPHVYTCYSRISAGHTQTSTLCKKHCQVLYKRKTSQPSQITSPAIKNGNGFYYRPYCSNAETTCQGSRTKVTLKSIISTSPQSEFVHSVFYMKQKYMLPSVWNNSLICPFSSSANRNYSEKKSKSTSDRKANSETASGVDRSEIKAS